ncbi:Copper transport protein 86 [Pseudozyma hubeiensis]|nr:Copper transport protein 86 [Pseudozyma hubeiensis]
MAVAARASGKAEEADAKLLLELLEQYKILASSRSSSAEQTADQVDAYQHLEAHLTHFSQRLARNASIRKHFATSHDFSAVLEALAAFFPHFQQSQQVRPPSSNQRGQAAIGDDLSGTPADHQNTPKDPYQRACGIATLLFRTTRNAMAGCSDAQDHLCLRFDVLAPFLDNITRYHTLNDPDATLLARSAVQMLSNLITANRHVQRQMWPRIVAAQRDQDRLLLKFLSSPDTATQSAAQILLINFLRTPSWTQDAHERCYELCTSVAGRQLVESLLSTSESVMLRTASAKPDESAQEQEPETEIQGLEESLGFVYTIFAMLFERGYTSLVLSSLAPIDEISSSPSSSSASDLPVITSSQLTLLKLLDSWLHLQQKLIAETASASTEHDACPSVLELLETPSRFSSIDARLLRTAGLAGLLDAFLSQARFARSAMAGGIARNGTSPDQQPQDRRLIGVHHGLLLLLQSLLSISMTADGWSDEGSSSSGMTHSTRSFADVARALLSEMRSNHDFIDELVELLDQTHQYAPALSPFRRADAANDERTSSEADEQRPLPQGHALSSTGRAAHESKDTQPSYGFDHLKRDIVRVLGSLVYAPTQAAKNDAEAHSGGQNGVDANPSTLTKNQIREVQDRVRERGGLFHVLNMTVLDERNPYMREHAIFALRYLLAGNAESQSLVGSLQPAQQDASQGGTQLPMV